MATLCALSKHLSQLPCTRHRTPT
uniref:Uncharacterized protein n=1 Tax=Rhizophora mucronata TaxID=61149 RepID=A0A2P2N1U3_RHIMU